MSKQSLLGFPLIYSDRVPELGGQDITLLPPCIQITITPDEMGRLRDADPYIYSPEGREQHINEIREILGPKRFTIVETARRHGQFIDVRIDWTVS